MVIKAVGLRRGLTHGSVLYQLSVVSTICSCCSLSSSVSSTTTSLPMFRRLRRRWTCRAMVQQAVLGGAPAAYAQEMERLTAKESLLLAVFTCKELYVGGSSHKRLTLSYSNCYAHNTYLCIPRKHDIISQCYSDKQEKLNIPHYDVTMKNRDKIPRHVIMRSELTRTGIPEVASPLTDISLRSKVRGICFYAVTSVVAIFLFVLMLVEHPFVLLLDRYRRKAHYFIAKMWASLTVGPFFKITVEGLENLPLPDTPAVYVSNHQSFLDIYTLLTLGRAFKFISKTSIFLFPVIGWAMFLLGVIPLKRMDSKSQLDCLKRCMDLVKKGASVFFFPEGTRSKDGKLGAFKKGAFSIAAKSKVPVVPITLIGTGKVMPSGMEGILNSGSVKVIIHKPIEGSDPQVLCNESRNIIANGLLNHNA